MSAFLPAVTILIFFLLVLALVSSIMWLAAVDHGSEVVNLLIIIGRTRAFNCSRYSTASSPSKWECGDGYCIEQYSVCDGEFDCLNGTDEFNCGEC